VDIYQEKGYRDRKHYLRSLADNYDVPYKVVLSIAEFLGPNEDFDGLITEIEDYIETREDDDDWEEW